MNGNRKLDPGPTEPRRLPTGWRLLAATLLCTGILCASESIADDTTTSPATPSSTPTSAGGAVSPNGNDTAPAPTNTADNAMANAQNSMAGALGVSKDFEFSQKHFSMMLGAVVLNPYNLEEEEEGSGEYFLQNGETDANVILELGFRYRWAWLDRVPAINVAEIDREVVALEQEISREKTKAQDLQDEDRIKRLQAQIKSLVELRDRVRPFMGQQALTTLHRHNSFQYFSVPSIWQAEGAGILIPDDWTIRLGYAFGSETPSGAAALVGSSDLYADMVVGWNLVRFNLGVAKSTETPTRGSINFEIYGAANSDRDLADIHGRGLAGLSFVFGIPYRATQADPMSPDQVVELVVRLGGVLVETPQYLDRDSNQVETQHQLPHFGKEYGAGADVEFNIPIPNDLGYISARGTFNVGFDPNPWTIMFGYSIPFGAIWDGLRGG